MKWMKRVLLPVFILLMLAPVCGQNSAEEFDPEQIDIFSFDPTEQAVSVQTDYRERAYTFYQEGRFDQAAKYYLAHLKFNPEDASSWYNLSCSFGLLGDAKEAAKYLKVAYKKGFRDLGHIRSDKDFDSVRTAKTFTAALDSLQIWNEKEAFYKGTMEYMPIRQYINYWVHLPKDFDAAKQYTLLIGMHGYGDVATNFSGLWRHISGENIIFVVPEAPYPFPESKNAAFSWAPFTPMESKTSEKAYTLVDDYIVQLARQMEKTYKIKQTWLLGFSQGAYFGYMHAIKNPGVFDGLIACGGGLVTDVFKDKEYRKAKKLQIIISHGRQDRIVDYSEAEKAFGVLKGKGLKVTLLDFEGGHSVSPAVFDEFINRIK